MKKLGIILIIVGGLMVLITGFNVVTKKKVVDLGPIEINKEEKTPIHWSPILGGIALISGLAMVIMDNKGIAK